MTPDLCSTPVKFLPWVQPFCKQRSSEANGTRLTCTPNSPRLPMKKRKDQRGKGQRAITSFLFTKTAGEHPKPNGRHPSSAPAEPTVPRHDAPGSPPLKRPRAISPDGSLGGVQHVSEDTGVVERSALAPPPKEAPAHADGAAAAAVPHSKGLSLPPLRNGGSASTDGSARPSTPGIPGRDPARHARMQSKLVGRTALPTQLEGGTAGPSSRASGPASTAKLTPLEHQVVELKRQYPDVLLIIEVGYKMRFFGSDAEAASRVLGIGCFPDHNFLTASVPVPRLAVHVRRLVEAGYRVGVVRQVETAAIKAAGANKSAPFERKLTGLYTKATLEAGELAGLGEGDTRGDPSASPSRVPSGPVSQPGALWSSQRLSSYLVCVVEDPVGPGGAGSAAWEAQQGLQEGKGDVEVGLVAVETSTGDVLYDQFRDSLLRAELEAKLLYLTPAEIVAAAPLTSPTRRLLGSFAGPAAAPAAAGTAGGAPGAAGGSAAGRGLLGGARGSAAARLEVVDGAKYKQGGALAAAVLFYGEEGEGGRDAAGSGRSGQQTHHHQAGGPPQSAAAVDAVLRLPPLVLRALAHALDYLRPLGVEGVLRLGAAFRELGTAQELALSPNTLRQLEVLSNTDDGSERGSLLWLLDHTLTAGGGRLMRRWATRPLRGSVGIEARLDAVQELLEQGDSHPVLSRIPAALTKLPDLERSLTRAFHGTTSPSEFVTMLRALGGLHRALGLRADLSADLSAGVISPDEVMADAVEGDVPPISLPGEADALPNTSLGDGGWSGEHTTQHAQQRRRHPAVEVPGVESSLLRQLLAAAGDLGVAAAARDTLQRLDEEAAAGNDLLLLLREADPPPFPAVSHRRAELAAAEQHLQSLLPALARQLNVRSVEYISLQNQGDFLVEVPVELAARVPKDWEKVSSTKKALRFHPPQVKAGIQRLALAREHLQAACAAAWKELLADFSRQYLAVRGAVQALAALDCLNSLASLASNAGYTRPNILDDSAPPQLHIVGGRHPVLDMTMGGTFVPNDTHLEGEGCSTLVVTGPNMGGKSVYIRQSALIAIMAQIGSFVPAESVCMHVMDGVYTRMGASDNIAQGRSTFLEELGEASAILASATPRSLVVIDELGRGTSTRDGVAIAAATLEYLARDQGCLTLFVTHYPQVAALHQRFPDMIATGFMSFLEEGSAGTKAFHNGAHPKSPIMPQPSNPTTELSHSAPASSTLPALEDGHAGTTPGGGSTAVEDEEAAMPKITFLYRLTAGVAPRSFGLNVARMAHLPLVVVRHAAVLAARLEAADKAKGRSQLAAGGAEHWQQEQQLQGRGSNGELGAAGAGRLGGEADEGRSRCHDAGQLHRTATELRDRICCLLGRAAAPLELEALRELQRVSRAAALGDSNSG